MSRASRSAIRDEIRARLVEQVTGRVRWRETVEWFAANGVTKIYEVGSGKVLSGLARRIARDVATVSVGTPGEIDAALAAIWHELARPFDRRPCGRCAPRQGVKNVLA